MSDTAVFEPGGYRFIKGPFQYSGGVAAQPGFQIERVMFQKPVPLDEGFKAIETFIRVVGRPLTSFCACELRSPAPFSEAGFKAFNEVYVGTLRRWEIFDGVNNPVARSNVCPAVSPPPVPSFHAFCFTTKAADAAPTFVASGSGEAPEGKGSYGDHIVARGDVSPAGMRKKAVAVLGEMERRMKLLGVSWRETTATQVYTVHDIHSFLAAEIVARGAADKGLLWHLCRPPVVELEYEMDCRGVALERRIGV